MQAGWILLETAIMVSLSCDALASSNAILVLSHMGVQEADSRYWSIQDIDGSESPRHPMQIYLIEAMNP